MQATEGKLFILIQKCRVQHKTYDIRTVDTFEVGFNEWQLKERIVFMRILKKSSSYFEFPASPKCYLKSKQKTGLFKGSTLFTPEVICAKHDVIMRMTYKTGDSSYAVG